MSSAIWSLQENGKLHPEESWLPGNLVFESIVYTM